MGVQYVEGFAALFFARRYARYLSRMMWVTLGVCVLAMFASSFSTQVIFILPSRHAVLLIRLWIERNGAGVAFNSFARCPIWRSWRVPVYSIYLLGKFLHGS